MFQISKSSVIGLHLMFIIAEQPEKKWALLELSNRLKISSNTCSKILQRLVHEGFLFSTKGPKGGFQLLKPLHTFYIKDILESLHGPIMLRSCLLNRNKCVLSTCIFNNVLRDIQHQFNDLLSSKTMAEIIKENQQLQ